MVENKNSWEEPVSFYEEELPDFPIEVFPTLLRDYIKAVAVQLKTNIDMPAMAMLGVLSTIFTRKYKFYLKETNWHLDVNLYLLTLAMSGSNKTQVNNEIKFPLDIYEKTLHQQQKSQIPRFINNIEVKNKEIEYLAKKLAQKPNEADLRKREELLKEIELLKKEISLPTVYLTGNTTLEKLFQIIYENNESLAIISDEFSELLNIILGKYSNKLDLELLLSCYDGVKIDRGREKLRELMVLNNPLLTIGAFTQPVVLTDFRSMDGRGLAERFLISMPKNKYRKGLGVRVDEEIKESFKSNILSIIEKMSDKNHEVKYIELGDIALDDYVELYDKAEREQFRNDNPEVLKSWYAKFIAKLMKIITLLNTTKQMISYGKVDNTKLGKEDLSKAKKLYHYFELHAREAFGVVKDNILEEDAKYLIKKVANIAKKNGRMMVTKTELQQNTKRKFNRDEREELIEFLVDLNFIAIKKRGNRTELHLNPAYKKALK